MATLFNLPNGNDNIYPDLTRSRFDIPYHKAKLLDSELISQYPPVKAAPLRIIYSDDLTEQPPLIPNDPLPPGPIVTPPIDPNNPPTPSPVPYPGVLVQV